MIDKSIPIPVRPKDILMKMEVGDSFLDKGATMENSRIYMAARVYKKRYGMQFKASTVECGVRIWRTA